MDEKTQALEIRGLVQGRTTRKLQSWDLNGPKGWAGPIFSAHPIERSTMKSRSFRTQGQGSAIWAQVQRRSLFWNAPLRDPGEPSPNWKLFGSSWSGPRWMRPCHLDKPTNFPRTETVPCSFYSTSQANMQHHVGLWVHNLFGNQAFNIVEHFSFYKELACGLHGGVLDLYCSSPVTVGRCSPVWDLPDHIAGGFHEKQLAEHLA